MVTDGIEPGVVVGGLLVKSPFKRQKLKCLFFVWPPAATHRFA